MASLGAMATRLRALAVSAVPKTALDSAVATASSMTRQAAPATSIATMRTSSGVRVTVAGPRVRTTQGWVHPATVFRTAVERLVPEVAQRTALEIREAL